MTVSTHSCAPRGLLRYLLVVLPTLLSVLPCARADEVPPLQPGLWEYQRTAGTSKFTATECIDPSEDLRRQHQALERMGCKVSPALHNGTTYKYAADCAIKLPSGVMTFSTTSVLTAESETAYQIENKMANEGGTSGETIKAQRVADCAN